MLADARISTNSLSVPKTPSAPDFVISALIGFPANRSRSVSGGGPRADPANPPSAS
jgi:hypothetical protein